MTCRHYRRLLSPHLDHALAADERSGVIAHLAQCSPCAELLHQLEGNRQLLRTLPAAEVTRGMELRLQSRVRGREQPEVRSSQFATRFGLDLPLATQPTTRPWRRGWGVLSAGTLATCAASVFFFFSNMHIPPSVSAEEVVGSMEELIEVLDTDDDLRVMYEETAEEALPDWSEDLNRWPAGDGRDLQLMSEGEEWRKFIKRRSHSPR